MTMSRFELEVIRALARRARARERERRQQRVRLALITGAALASVAFMLWA